MLRRNTTESIASTSASSAFTAETSSSLPLSATTADSAPTTKTVTSSTTPRSQIQHLHLVSTTNKKTCTASSSSVLKSAQTTNSVNPASSAANTFSKLTSQDSHKHKFKENKRKKPVLSKPKIEYIERELSIQDFDKLCDKYLRKPYLSNFVKYQARLATPKARGRRYVTSFREFALTIYSLDPRCYSFLQNLFYLPAKRTIRTALKKDGQFVDMNLLDDDSMQDSSDSAVSDDEQNNLLEE